MSDEQVQQAQPSIREEMLSAMKGEIAKGEADGLREEKGTGQEAVKEAAPAAPAPATPAPEEALPERNWESLLARNKENIELKKKIKELESFGDQQKKVQAQLDEYKDVKQFLEVWKKDPIAYLDQMLGDRGLQAWMERRKGGANPPGASGGGAQADEIKALKSEIESLRKQTTEHRESLEQERVNETARRFLEKIETAASSLGDKQSRLFQRLNGSSVAMEIASLEYQASGRLMEPKEAATAAWNKLLKQLQEDATEASDLIGLSVIKQQEKAAVAPQKTKEPKQEPKAEERRPKTHWEEREETRRQMVEAMKAVASANSS